MGESHHLARRRAELVVPFPARGVDRDRHGPGDHPNGCLWFIPGSQHAATTCAYMPDGTTCNGERNILTDEQIVRLQVGRPLDDESQNPMVWSRTRASMFA